MATLWMLARSLLSLGVVLAVLYLLARVARRSTAGVRLGGASARAIPCLQSRTAIGKGQALAVVTWQAKTYLIGIAPGHISVLDQSERSEESEDGLDEDEVVELGGDPGALGVLMERWGQRKPSAPNAKESALWTELKRMVVGRRK